MYFKKCFIIKIFSSIITSLIYFLLYFFILFDLLNSTHIIFKNKISTFFYTNQNIEKSNSYFVVSDYYKLINNDKQINTNILMQKKNNNYDIIDKKSYKTEEAAITGSLLKKLKKKKGEYLIIENPYNHKLKKYLVSNVINEIQINGKILDYDLLIIGYDNNFIEFKKTKESLNIIKYGEKINDDILPSKIVSANKMFFLNFVIVFVFIIIQILFSFFVSQFLSKYDIKQKKYIKKLFLYGEKVSKIKLYLFLKGFISILIILTPLLFFVFSNYFFSIFFIPLFFYIFFDLGNNSFFYLT